MVGETEITKMARPTW